MKIAVIGSRTLTVRDLEIIDNADFVLAFWDGKSRGTKFVIDNCRKINKPIRVLISKGCL